MPRELSVFGGTANLPLAEAIARALGGSLGARAIERFPDGEIEVRLGESVRGHQVYIVQPTTPPVNDNLVELLLLADACRRASAERVTAVVPYFGYARSDRRHGAGAAVGARVVADLMEAVGIAQLITLDLHTPQVEGFFRIPVDGLSALGLLAAAARECLTMDAAVVVAPDAGRVKMATAYAQELGVPLVVLHKRRESGTRTAVTHLVGDVRGRQCLIIDDLISTGGTIAQSAQALREAGARPNVVVAATHALMLGDAAAKMRRAGVERVLTTDTIACRLPDDAPFVHTVSVAQLIAAAIQET
jgi:ribose-phosphate pyrophosphokinase